MSLTLTDWAAGARLKKGLVSRTGQDWARPASADH